MELNKTTCPSCGATGTAGRYCEFCGNKIPFPEPERRKGAAGESAEEQLIVEFRMEEEDAVSRMLYELSERTLLPADFYTRFSPERPLRYYVPAWYIEGNFEAPWSCVKLESETYEVYNHREKRNETRTRTLRYPMNGVAMGGFAFLACANLEEDTPEGVFTLMRKEMTEEAEDYHDAAVSRGLTPDEQALCVPRSELHPEKVWEEWCDKALADRVSSSVYRQLPWSHEDLSYSYQFTRECTLLQLPFWTVHFEYNNDGFTFATDGLGKHIRISSPIAPKEAATQKSLKAKLSADKSASTRNQWLFGLTACLSAGSAFFMYAEGRPPGYGYYGRGNFAYLLFFMVCTGLAVFFAFKAKWAMEKRAASKSRLADFEFDQWVKRKKQLLSTLGHENFGMSDECAKALRDKVSRELAQKKRPPVGRTYGFVLAILSLVLTAAWLAALLSTL